MREVRRIETQMRVQKIVIEKLNNKTKNKLKSTKIWYCQDTNNTALVECTRGACHVLIWTSRGRQ